MFSNKSEPYINLNTHTKYSGGTEYVIKQGNNYILADPLVDHIHWLLVFIITPTIALIGIIGNCLSLFVIVKQGFSKSSNILLFGLAVSDILFMVGINGPAKPMYEWGSGGFTYPEPTARALHYLYQFFDSLNWITGPTSCSIPALITVERLVAVFLPLKFSSIVTPRRTIIAVAMPLITSIAIQIYIRACFQFTYTFDSNRNISVGMSTRNDIFRAHRHVLKGFEIFFNSFFVLVIFVGCGSIAIGVKVKLMAQKRKTMTNGFKGQNISKTEDGMSRTTKMLLCLCVFYTFACAPIGFPAIIPGFMVLPVFEEEPNFRSVGVFIYHVYKLFFCINSSSNFFIFVATNKVFRDILKDSFSCRHFIKKSKS